MHWQQTIQNSLGVYLPSILGALAILIVGWILALVAAAFTRKGLRAARANERLSAQSDSKIDFEKLVGRLVFWTMLLLALIGALSVLRIEGVSGPLSALATTVLVFVPRLLLAAAIALLAWLVASAARFLLDKALDATQVDERLSEAAGMQPLSRTMGNVAYWLVLLLFLPAIVGVLQIEGLMTPLTAMTRDFFGMLPNLFAAAVIATIGWIVAKAVRGLVANLLTATGIDRFGQAGQAASAVSLSRLGGTLAFVLVIVPTLIAALDALRITAISTPLTGMLDVFLQSIPHLVAAAVILLLAWFIGRFIADLLAQLLANLGFDRLPERLGFASTQLQGEVGGDPATPTAPLPQGGTLSLSTLAARIALFFIMLFATVEAAGMLGFDGVHDLLAQFIAFGADVLLGLVIFVVGYWLADVAARAVLRTNRDSVAMARIARIAILGLVIAMGLRAMGIADDIVNLAFGLVLGAAAVATALAFGLGGREAAGKVAERWARGYLERSRD